MRPERIAAVLLAAGQSARFGERDKLVAEYRGKPLAVHALENVAALPFAHLIAVVRSARLSPELHRRLDRRGYTLIVNDAPEEGISGSIVRAVEQVKDLKKCQGMLICLADMPNVPQSHITRIINEAVDIRSLVASTDGFTPCPPCFIGRKHFPHLAGLRGDQGARALLSQAVLIETSGPALHDIDTPEDLGR